MVVFRLNTKLCWNHIKSPFFPFAFVLLFSYTDMCTHMHAPFTLVCTCPLFCMCFRICDSKCVSNIWAYHVLWATFEIYFRIYMHTWVWWSYWRWCACMLCTPHSCAKEYACICAHVHMYWNIERSNPFSHICTFKIKQTRQQYIRPTKTSNAHKHTLFSLMHTKT